MEQTEKLEGNYIYIIYNIFNRDLIFWFGFCGDLISFTFSGPFAV